MRIRRRNSRRRPRNPERRRTSVSSGKGWNVSGPSQLRFPELFGRRRPRRLIDFSCRAFERRRGVDVGVRRRFLCDEGLGSLSC